VKSGLFSGPRKGKFDDKAHPPIHPVRMAGDLTPREFKVYELISRSFLASVSKDAKGESKEVTIRVGKEQFSLKGL
jgi:DNA topoisomerase-3